MMNLEEIRQLLERVNISRKELKKKSVKELEDILDSLKDAQDFLEALNSDLERNIMKLEEILAEMEEEE